MSNPKKPNTGDDFFNTIMSPAAVTASTDKMESNQKKLLKQQNGLDNSDINTIENSKNVVSSVNTSLNKLFAQITPSGSLRGDVGVDTIDNMLLMAQHENKYQEKQRGDIGNKGTRAKKLQDLNSRKNEVLNANNQHLEAMIRLHKSKSMESLATYNLIIKIIPKMRLALNTYATSILSPDEFSKNNLTIAIEQTNLDQDVINRATKRSTDLLDKFNINPKIKEDILSYLINGRLFYLVSTMNVQLARMLSEETGTGIGTGQSPYNSPKMGNYLSESIGTALRESVESKRLSDHGHYRELIETFNLNDNNVSKILNESLDEDQKGKGAKVAAERLEKLIESEIILGNANSLLEDDSEALLEGTDVIGAFSNFGISPDTDQNQLAQPVLDGSKRDTVDPDNLKGNDTAVVKRISPSNIVPLELDGKKYGYIYLDIVEIDPDNHVLPVDSTEGGDPFGMLPSSASTLNNGAVLQNIVSSGRDVAVDGNNRSTGIPGGSPGNRNYENPTQSPGIDASTDARLMFMAKVFANKLSKDTNLKLIRKSESLRSAIYNGLAVKKLCSNQKLRVVYLKPEEVVFINRGHSIFDNVLFFCKLYIATLITILLQNILNGGERRVVYVEVGEDNNGSQAVNQVIRDLKAREVTSVMGMDIQTVLNIQSQFQDYYIPVVDGEKPVTFETMDSLNNKGMDDEFLNWLGGNIFSGMGLPASYTQEVENIDFAKMLSMQNSRYLREVVTEQAVLSPGFTELLRKIYTIEYSNNLTDDKAKDKKAKKEKRIKPENVGSIAKKSSKEEAEILADDDLITPNMLSVKLPTPAALALQSIVDQIGNASGMVDTIMQFSNVAAQAGLTDDDPKAEVLKNTIRSKLLRKLVSSADWPEIDGLITSAISEFIEDNVAASINKKDAEDNTADAPDEPNLTDTEESPEPGSDDADMDMDAPDDASSPDADAASTDTGMPPLPKL